MYTANIHTYIHMHVLYHMYTVYIYFHKLLHFISAYCIYYPCLSLSLRILTVKREIIVDTYKYKYKEL